MPGGGGGGGGGRRRQNLVPQARQGLDQLKYEVAQSIGVVLPQDGYYGFLQTRDAGAIGGNMVRTMVTMAEQQLATQFSGAAGGTAAGAAGGATGGATGATGFGAQ